MRASATSYQSESEIEGRKKPEAGQYHVICKDGGAKENPAKKGGALLNASLVECEVLAGTVPDQEGKEIAMFLPLDDAGNPGEKHVRFLMAAGLLPPGSERDIDFESEVPGCQLVVQLDAYTNKAGKKDVSVAEFGLAMFHVDNPAVRDVPKCKEALDLIPAERRLPAGGNGGTPPAPVAAAAKPAPKPGGNGKDGKAATAAKPAVAAATAPAKLAADNDFSDL